MARCLAWGAENGFSAEEIAGDNPIPPEVTDDTENLADDLIPSAERVDASRVVRLGEGPETVYVYDTAYCRDKAERSHRAVAPPCLNLKTMKTILSPRLETG
jgi:hypothetical protein